MPEKAKLAAEIVAKAAAVAAEVVRTENNSTTESLIEALRAVFGENEEAKRFVDISRIPLLCKSVIEIHENLKSMNEKLDTVFVRKDEFSTVRMVVFGFVGLVMVAFIGGLISLVFIK